MTHLRPDLLPGLLAAAARNQARGFMDLSLFEIGPAFQGGEPGDQHLQASGLLVGAAAQRDPHGSRRMVDVFDAKADAEESSPPSARPPASRSAARLRTGGIPAALA